MEEYKSDFEDDSESDDEKENVDDNCLCQDIGFDVKVKFSSKTNSFVKSLKASKCTPAERNRTIKPSHLPAGACFVSSVYKIEKSDEGQEPVHLSDLDDELYILLPIEYPCFDKAANEFTELFIGVICDDGNLDLLDSKFEEGYALSKIKTESTAGKSFVVISSPKTFSLNAQPNGTTTEIPSAGVKIKFEPKCVKEEEPIRYKIELLSNKYLRQNKPKGLSRIIIAVSNRITFFYDKSRFTRPIKVEFTMSLHDEEHWLGADVKFLVMGYRNGQIIVDNIMRKNDDVTFLTEVKGYDGICLAVCRPFKQDNKTTKTKLENELHLCFGTKLLCCILVLYHNRSSKTVWLSVEACFIEQQEKCISYQESKGGALLLRSETVLLKPVQRLKISPSGAIGLGQGKGSHVWLNFVSIEERNLANFQVQIHRSLGKSPEAVLAVSTDHNEDVTKVRFSLDAVKYPDKLISEKVSKPHFVPVTIDLPSKPKILDEDRSVTPPVSVTVDEEIKRDQVKWSGPVVKSSGLLLTKTTIDRFEQ